MRYSITKNLSIKFYIRVQPKWIELWMMVDVNTILKCTVNGPVHDEKVYVLRGRFSLIFSLLCSSLDSNHSLVCSTYLICDRKVLFQSLIFRKILNGQQRMNIHRMAMLLGNNDWVQLNASIEPSLSELCMA